ncbi:IspD/TarI family cytidylyltransferase [Mycobacterium sp. IDR2000157661]|uniref:IspD/TarI family cytidylyltransferase n=1 Tax=Mycobacterium sp. IDR2000157661 TaxID=2867005 RepID=UPI001EEF628C|nr:2-C-methyl-D-erythritol 4-phosphate cytidylyltransferase [Mycobacterium sp. IDR2000157661]
MAPPDRELSAIVQLAVGADDSGAAGLDPLAGRAPLLRVIDTLLRGVGPQIVVVAGESIADAVGGVLADHDMASVRVVAVGKPATPMRFLAAGLEELLREHPSSRWVLVHDLRQPLASPPVTDRVLALLREGNPVVVPALPVTDSVKAVDERGSVAATLDRTALRAVQYPRGFAVAHLAELLNRPPADDLEVDAAVLTHGPITVVDGDSAAFVAELPGDAPFLEAIIAGRRSY